MFSAKSRGNGQTGGNASIAGQGNGKPSILAAGLRIRGDIEGEGDLLVEGRLEGHVSCSNLTIGESGEVIGTVRAESVLLHGRIEGEVEAENVTLARTARMFGDVRHAVLTVETGAEVVGRYSRIDTTATPSKAVVTARQDTRAPSAKGAPPTRPAEDTVAPDIAAGLQGDGGVSADAGAIKPPLH